MEYVYIDAALLAIPNYAIDTVTAEALFERVSHFAQLATSSRSVKIVVSENLEVELWDKNLGPSYDQVRDFVDIMDLGGVFSAADLARVYQTLFNVSLRALPHNSFEVEAISDFYSAPQLPNSLSPVEMVANSQRMLTEVAALNAHADRWNVASAFDHPQGELMNVTSTINSIFGANQTYVPSVPITVSHPVRIISSIDDLAHYHSSFRIWQNATSADDIHLSLQIGIEEVLNRDRRAGCQIKDFAVGTGFLNSLNQHQCGGAGRFSAIAHALCVQLVTGTSNKRIGTIGRPQQEVRARDGALGHRVHLTKHHPPLRLMFWDAGGLMEFANVGIKTAHYIDRG